MRVHKLQRVQRVARPLELVFEFFARAGNLERITPPWLSFGLLSEEPIEMREGALIEYRLRLHGVPLRWISRIEEWEPGRLFVDRQIEGPYSLWHHEHQFTRVNGDTLVRDRVRYALPLGPLGELGQALFVRRDLDRIFRYRYEAVERLLG